MLSMVKVFHILYILTLPIAIILLASLPKFGFVPIFAHDTPELNLIILILSFFSILFCVIGLLLPRLAKWRLGNRDRTSILVTHGFIRLPLFESTVIITFIMGLLGVGWYIIGPLFILEGIALSLTFPSSKRFEQWQGE